MLSQICPCPRLQKLPEETGFESFLQKKVPKERNFFGDETPFFIRKGFFS